MWIKTAALSFLFAVAGAALCAMDITVATGQWLGLTESSPLGSYLLLHGVLFALVASPLLGLALFFTGRLQELVLVLALTGIVFTGMAGYRLAESKPAYHLEFNRYPVLWLQRQAI